VDAGEQRKEKEDRYEEKVRFITESLNEQHALSQTQ